MQPLQGVAAPAGGNIIGGSGTISTNGSTTNIHQNTQSLAINWNSFNVEKSETVNFLQPGFNSIALNRILSNNPSQILGQINANGHIVLVNPNGVFFGQNATVNVGGLIASGLDISAADFMNGDYLFNQVSETDGIVFNSGLLNASLGGNITLLGKQVVNDGVISANLGRVNLVAGEAAVLTFDQQGLLGVQVTDAVLQDDLRVDPALSNSGEISAQGGQVLLTASVSQDVFSQAVNIGSMEQATSVVVNEDGSFTLGAGADVNNTGAIDVSTTGSGHQAGKVVVLGENITHSGNITADSVNTQGGEIELLSSDETRLTGDSFTSASSETKDAGLIKIQGDKVGLFDSSQVDASGYLNGGEILIGGDYQGKNDHIKNASISYVGENVLINANSEYAGDGGKIIQWSDSTSRFYGRIQAQGGKQSGNGGFAEISGKDYLDFNGGVDLFAISGQTGTLLLDPQNITIEDGGGDTVSAHDAFTDNPNTSASFDADLITDILTGVGVSAADVTLEARGDIWVKEAIDISTHTGNSHSLTLRAGDDIEIDADIKLVGGTLTISQGDYGCYSNCINLGTLVADDGSVLDINSDLSTVGGDIILGNTYDFGDSDIIKIGSSGKQTINISTGASGLGDITFNDQVYDDDHDYNVNNDVDDNNNTNSSHAILNLTAGTGKVTFKSDAGTSTNYLAGLNVLSASEANFYAVNTGSGGFKANGSTLNLDGQITTNNGLVDLDSVNDIVLYQGVSTSNGAVNINVTGGYFDNDYPNGGIAAGSGDITIDVDGTTASSGCNGCGAWLGDVSTTGGLTLNTSDGNGHIRQDNQAYTISVGGNTVLNAGTGNIELNETLASNNFTGSLTLTAATANIRDINSINLGNVSISGSGNALTLLALGNGNITQAADTSISVNTAGAITSLTAEGNSVNVNDRGLSTNNDFDQITVTAASTSIADRNAIQLNAFNISGTNATTLEVLAGGAVRQGGELDNNGTDALTLINAPGQSVTLANSANDFTRFSVFASTADIADDNSIAMADSTITGTSGTTLKITANGGTGSISQVSGTRVLNNHSGVITELIAVNDDVTLDQSGNDFSQVNITAGTSTITDSDDIVLGQITLTGSGGTTFDLTAGGAVSQTVGDDIDNNGNGAITRINATGYDITLANNANDFTTVQLAGSNVDIYDAGDIDLGTSTISGTLGVTSLADGDITQSGIVEVTGHTTLVAEGDDITLNNGGNDFSSVDFDGALNVDIHDTNSIVLYGASGLTTLNISTLGNDLDAAGITQTGAFAVSGASSFNATGGQILLTQANSFGNAVSLNNSGNNNVSITNNGLLNLDASALGSGAFTVNNTGGNISQNDSITQASGAGLVTLNAGTNTIDLQNTGNDFTGALALTANQALITDSNAVQLADSTITTSGLTITARGGSITQLSTGNGLDVTGTASFSSTDGFIALNNLNNDFKGDVDLTTSGTDGTAGLSEITDVNDLTLTVVDINSSSGGFTANATAINLNGDVSSSDGDVTFDAPVTLSSTALALNPTVNTINTGTGGVNFNSTLDGQNSKEQSLTVTSGGVNFYDDVGNLTPLRAIILNATGDISVESSDITPILKNIYADSLLVNSSTNFTSGNIDTVGDVAASAKIITINSSGSINTGNLVANGGMPASDSTGLDGDTVTLNGDNVTTGNIDTFGSNATGVADNAGGAAGSIDINASTANTHDISVGNIDTHGGLGAGNSTGVNGGSVVIHGNHITLSEIQTSASDATATAAGVYSGGSAGTINIVATELTTPSTVAPAITLTGDIIASAGAGVNGGFTPADATANLSLVGTSNGSVDITYQTDFTGLIEISGSSGFDTITGANRTNTWNITNANFGDLNSNISFSSFENLVGNGGDDTFDFAVETSHGSIDGLVDGAAGLDTINLYTLATATTVNTTVQLGASEGVNSNGVLEVSGIETINANTQDDNTLNGPDLDTDWFIGTSHSGSLGGTGLTTDATDGEVIFSGFNKLQGGTQADVFEIVSTSLSLDPLTIDGGNGGASQATSQYDTLIGPNMDTTWTLDTDNGGTLVGANATALNVRFDDIENLQAGSGDDTFDFDIYDVDGSVDAGGNTATGDTIDLSGLTTVTFDMSDLTIGRTGFESVKGNWNGSSGDSTITGPNSINDWQITGENSGEIVGVIKFTNFNNVTGGTDVDTFTILDAGTITGLIDGGTDGSTARNDSVDLTDKTSPVTVYLGATSSGASLYEFAVSNIETLIGNSGSANTIVGANEVTTWRVDSVDGGAVTSTGGLASAIPVGATEGITKFSNFANLTGGTAADIIIVEDAGDITGLIDGGSDGTAGTTNDSLDLTAKTTAVTVQVDSSLSTLAAGVYDIVNIETLSGNGSNANTILVTDVATTWRIDSVDGGAVTSTGGLASAIPAGTTEGITKFSNFANLTGGTAADSFIIEDAGDITGLIDGGSDGSAGTTNDSVNLTAKTTAVSVQLDSNLLNLTSSIDIVNIETLTGNAGYSNTINGADNDTTWLIGASDSGAIGNATALASGIPAGTVEGVIKYSGFDTFNGGSAIDTYKVIASSVQATIDGDQGANSSNYDHLIGPDVDTKWTINRNNGGILIDQATSGTNLNVAFYDIENLQSGSGDDSFAFTGTNNVDGSVDAGGQSINGLDEVDLSAQSSVEFNMALGFGGSRTGFESVKGNGVDSNIIGDNSSNHWVIDGPNKGYLTGGISFSDFNNITGGTVDDTFTFEAAGDITGLIDGKANTSGIDRIDLTNKTNNVTAQISGTINLNSNGILEFLNIEQIDANTAPSLSNELIADAQPTNQWVIDGSNSGMLNTTLRFNGFSALTGVGSANDLFTIAESGLIRGIVTGGTGTGNDQIINAHTSDTDWAITGANAVRVSGTNFTGIEELTGSNGVKDSFRLQAANGGLTIHGGSTTTDEIINELTLTTAWVIDNTDTGTVSGNGFDGVEYLTGADNVDDNFTIAEVGSISGIVKGGAGTGNDQIINAHITDTDWAITGANAVTVSGTSFTGIEELTGSNSVKDSFRLQAANGGLTIHGGSTTTDEIINELALTTAWVIDNTDTGTVAGNGFDGVEYLTGADNVNDNFTVTNTGAISGSIDGGTGIDSLNLTAKMTDVTVKLGQIFIADAFDIFNTENLEIVTARSTTHNTLIGADVNQLWVVNAVNAGAVGDATLLDGGIPVDATEGITKFSNFEHLLGGDADDNFRFIATGKVSSMDGGSHIRGDTIDKSRQTSVLVEISDSGLSGYTGIEGYTGNSTNSTLVATNANNSWNISGQNDGTVTYNDGTNDVTFTFYDFNILRGGSGIDEFTVESGGSIEAINANASNNTGIYGGAGNDTLTVNLTGTENGQVALFDGEGDSNSVTFRDDPSAGSTGFTQAVYTPVINNAQATHSFENYTNGVLDNGYTVTYQNATNAVNDNASAETLIINGTSVADEISLSSNSFQISSGANVFTSVGYTGKNNIIVNAGSGADSIELTGALNLGTYNIELSAETIINDNTDLITANTLTLDTLTSLSTPLQTHVNNLGITNSADSSAELNINEQGGIALNSLGLTGRINLEANGNITQNNALASNATIDLTTISGNIDLTDPDNALTGALIFAASGAVDLNNTVATNLAGVTSASLSVNSNNMDINDSGNIVTTTALFTAGIGSIQLDSSGNNFGTLSIGSAHTVTVNDINAIQLGNINMGTAAGTGTFTLTSTGVSQLSGTAFTQQSPPSEVLAGAVTFNAGNGEVTLDQDNDFTGPVSINNAGNNNVVINDINAIDFAASNLGAGSFTVTAGGAITQSGAITQATGAGAVSITTGSGAIALSNSGNDFNGGITLLNTGANDVTFSNHNNINIVSASVGRNLQLNAIGAFDITQSGPVTVAGTTGLSLDAGQSVDLQDPNNHFGQVVSIQSNGSGSLQSVSLYNDEVLSLATLELAGDLTINAQGAVNQTGEWRIAGDTEIDSNGANVDLTNRANDFYQIVFVDANDVNLVDANGVILGVGSAPSVIAGTLDIQTLAGDIQQNLDSAIQVVGQTTLNAGAGSGNVLFNANSNNDFSSVNIVSANDVSLSDQNDITIASENIFGDLQLTSAGSINDGANGLSVTGDSMLTAAANGSIYLDNASNTLNGLLTLSAASGSLYDVTVYNGVGTNLGAVDVAHQLTLVSAGAISQQGGFNLGANGATTLTAIDASQVTQDITLGSVNDLNTLVVTDAHNVTINNGNNTLVINELNATGFIDIISGNLTTTSAIAADGIQLTSATGNYIFNAALDSSAGIDISAGSLAFYEQISAQNDLNLTTQIGDLSQNASLHSSAGGITLNSAGTISMISSAGSSTVNGDISYTAVGNIDIGTLSAGQHTIRLDSQTGSIMDPAGNATSLIANALVIHAAQAIGTGDPNNRLNSNRVNMQVSTLDAVSDQGSIWLSQNGDLEIIALHATAENTRIDMDAYNSDVTVNLGSIATSRNTGTVFIVSETGSFRGNSLYDLNNADITANTATFFATAGDFGLTGRPIVLDVPTSGSVYIDANHYNIRFSPETPRNVITTGVDVSSLGVIQAITGEQLVEVESLGDIDPAIFTELRNYSHVDVSIRMPRDQLYEDELEEEDRLLQAM